MQLSEAEAHGPYGMAEDPMQIPSRRSTVLRDHIIVLPSAIGHARRKRRILSPHTSQSPTVGWGWEKKKGKVEGGDGAGGGAAEESGGACRADGRRRDLDLLPQEDADHLRLRDPGDRRDSLARLGVLRPALLAVVHAHARTENPSRRSGSRQLEVRSRSLSLFDSLVRLRRDSYLVRLIFSSAS
ncbi:hypothetical protein BHE74_00011136 [Ensete ventricosum]|nr:hypothetical protein BHE74_00011136 [Ensete ventricosum]